VVALDVAEWATESCPAGDQERPVLGDEMDDIRGITLVTWGPFSVSVTTGSGIAGCILTVRRDIEVSEQCARRHGYLGKAADGKHRASVGVVREPFPSTDAAFRWALEHGYHERYFAEPALRAARVRNAAASRGTARGYARGDEG
jgi:hypothetical protein